MAKTDTGKNLSVVESSASAGTNVSVTAGQLIVEDGGRAFYDNSLGERSRVGGTWLTDAEKSFIFTKSTQDVTASSLLVSPTDSTYGWKFTGYEQFELVHPAPDGTVGLSYNGSGAGLVITNKAQTDATHTSDITLVLNDATHKLSNKVDKVKGKSLIDTGVANNISYADSAFKLVNRWSFNVAEMTHTSPAGGAMDLKFAIDSGLTLTTSADSGDFDITLVKGSKTHKLSEKLSTIRIADGEGAGSLKIGRTSYLSTEGPYSIAIGFNGHTGPDAMGAVAISGGEALGAGSVAFNSCTAKGNSQIAFGKLNITDTNNKYACIIGNGTTDSKGNKTYSNAYTIDWDGNGWFAGDVEGVKNGTTHKLSEKVSFGDNYNTTEAGAYDAPIKLHGITEGADVGTKPIGIELNPGAGGGSTASITVGCDSIASSNYSKLDYNQLIFKGSTSEQATLSITGFSCQATGNTASINPSDIKCTLSNGRVHSLVGKSEAKTYTVSVPTTSWTTTTSGNSTIYKKTITVTGITATDTPIVDVVLSDTVDTAKKQLEAYGCISRITTAANSITIYCYESAPTTAFTIQLLNVTNRQ